MSTALLMRINCSSCHTSIFKLLAFSYLLPGLSPTTTTDVLELTEDDTFPPRLSIISVALSLVMLTSVPVNTNVFPLNSSFSSSLHIN